MRRISTRVVVVAGLLLTLVLAGAVSLYASSSPDGLERVAEDQGFLDRADKHAAADGPLAGYTIRGVDDERLASGLAGVTGSLVVLLVAGGLAFVVRRRSPASHREDRD